MLNREAKASHLELVGRIQRQLLAAVDDLLGLGHRERTHRGDGLDGRERARHQLVRGENLVAKADAQGLVSPDHLAGDTKLERAGHPDPPQHTLRATKARNDRELDLWLAELGLLGRVDEVTGERHLAAAPEGKAVDGRDDRYA